MIYLLFILSIYSSISFSQQITYLEVSRNKDECWEETLVYNGTHTTDYLGSFKIITIKDKLNSRCDGEKDSFALSNTHIYKYTYGFVESKKEVWGSCSQVRCCMWDLYMICQNKIVKFSQKF